MLNQRSVERIYVYSAAFIVGLALFAIFPPAAIFASSVQVLGILFNLQWRLPEEEPLPLHVYVCAKLDPAASKFEVGDYQGALSNLEKVGLDGPTVFAESHYIRALCLQSLGRFDEAIIDYEQAENHSSLLKNRADSGLELCREKLRAIPRAMVRFRRLELAPDYHY